VAGMKVLVIGQGGREHALVKKFVESQSVSKVYCATGNPGIAKIAECISIDWKNFELVKDFCLKASVNFVFIGPDDVVASGLADFLRTNGINVVAPSMIAAQLESSKIFCKEFLKRAGIPTSHFQIVNSVKQTLDAAKNFTPPYVFKADGLAAGKGVTLAQNLSELEAAAADCFDKKIFGSAGNQALLEGFIQGWELSYIFLTNGVDYQLLPLAQDHKRLHENNLGPNTGGMGTIAPIPISQKLNQKIIDQVVNPTLKQLQNEKLLYRGVVFVGLIIDEQENPWVLEYNCRFGDPETQVILPLINSDFAKACFELSQGKMMPLQFSNQSACCVIMAAPGYPTNPQKNLAIAGDAFAETKNSYFIHAGTKISDGQILTSGGRVLGSIGTGETLKEAIKNSYDQIKLAQWPGMHARKDIGQKFSR
jgi:phosphoribosylamine--glycine ligase